MESNFGWKNEELLVIFRKNGCLKLDLGRFLDSDFGVEDYLTELDLVGNVRFCQFDSREISPILAGSDSGDAFFAVNSNAHDFIIDAILAGAKVCILHRKVVVNSRKKLRKLLQEAILAGKIDPKNLNCVFIVAPDSLKMLQKLASIRREKLAGIVIGVTGSVGKTTSKQALVHFFSKAGRKVVSTPKNYNNLLGISYFLANVDVNSEIFVVEIGTNHPGEIDELGGLVRPDFSLITHVGPAHIEFFKTIGNIALEKGALLKHTKICAFFNNSYWYSVIFERICVENGVKFRCFSNDFCPHFDQDFAIRPSLEVLRNSWRLIFDTLGENFEEDRSFGMHVPGRSDVFNARLNGQDLQVVDSSYNANLTSMIDQIKFFNAQFLLLKKKYPEKNFKQLAILGDMREIGDHAIRYHQVLSAYLRDVCLFLVGSKMIFLHEKHSNSFWFENWENLIDFMQKNVDYNALVLVKGGNAMKLAKVVEFLKKSE